MKNPCKISKHGVVQTLFVATFAAVASVALAGTLPVDLGTAGNFTILAKTGVSTTGPTRVVGNIGLSPAAASYITGFGLSADPSNQFSTSPPYVVGQIYAADYAPPTPEILTTAVGDMLTAFTDAAGRAPGVTELGAGDISGLTLTPNVYKWSSGVLINATMTLSGGPNDVWIFEIAQDLTLANGVSVNLIGGAQAKNIFWQVAGITTLGTTSVMNGNILCQTKIVFKTGATLNGKALAQTAVTLDAATLTSAAGTYSGQNPPPAGQTFAYPSPVKRGIVNFVYNMQSSGEVLVRVWNENGDLAATIKERKLNGYQKSQLVVNTFAPGIYMYKISMVYDNGKKEDVAIQKFAVAK